MQVRMKDNSELEFYSGKFCVHAILEELKMAKAMKKKVTFYRLKEGTTFKYQRKVYIKSDYDIGVQLTGRDKGEQLDFEYCGSNGLGTLITPVKVKITVLNA